MTAKAAADTALTQWFRWLDRHAVIVLLLAVVSAFASLAFTLATIGINTSTTDMLSADLPFRQNDIALRAALPDPDERLFILVQGETAESADAAVEMLVAGLRERPDRFKDVFSAAEDAFFRRNGLLYLGIDELAALGDRLAEVQPLLAALKRDPSLRGLAEVLRMAAENATQATALGPALDDIAQATRSVAQESPRPLSWSGLLSDERGPVRRLVTVRLALDFADLEPAKAAMSQIEYLSEPLRDALAVEIRVTGEPAMFQEELDTLRKGMEWVGALSLILVALILGFGMRSLRLVVATLATLLVGLAWTAGLATLLVGELNLISIAFAVLFIGLGVDFAVHVALRFRRELGRDETPVEAAGRTGSALGGAVALCALSTSIGFFSFLLTSYRGLAELGLISGCGMFVALFACFTVLPAILLRWPPKPTPVAAPALLSRILDRAGNALVRRRRTVTGLALLLACAAAATLPFARFDDDPVNLRDPDSPSVATLLQLLEDPEVQPYGLRILTDDLATAEALAAELEALPEVYTARTLASLVPDGQEANLESIDEMRLFLAPLLRPAESAPPPGSAETRAALDDLLAALDSAQDLPGAGDLAAALRELDLTDPATLETLSRVLLSGFPPALAKLETALRADLVNLEDLPPVLRRERLASDGRALVEVSAAGDMRDSAARSAFVSAVQAVAPSAGGEAAIITAAGRAVVAAFLQATGYAAGLVILLLFAALRSLRDVAMVLAPLLLAALLTVAATVVIALPFNFANVIVLPLLFGFGVDSGIHLVMRERRHGPATDQSTAESESHDTTACAILISALTTLASFGALSLSPHPGTASMGQLLAIAIAAVLVCVLVVLPALQARFPRKA